MKHSILMATNKFGSNEENSIRSAIIACEFANQNNIPSEVILVVNGNNASYLEKEILGIFKNKPIKIFKSVLAQLTASLNYGLNFCQGEYISRFDSDDKCIKERLVILDKYTKDLPDIIAAPAVYNDSGKEHIVYPKGLANTLYLQTPFIHPATSFKRNFLVNELNGYLGFEYSQDYNLALRSFDAGASYKIIDEPLIEYTIGESQKLKKDTSITMQIACGFQRLLNKFSFKLALFILIKIIRHYLNKLFRI